ncbi:MAG TPA: glycosyltransferase family 4 protein [Cytophagaceae bacterium]|jgi:glycosyltransferase involved in cell wall biosynthesis
MEPRRKILIICPYPVNKAPSQRLKYEQYFDDWKMNGFEITTSPFMSNYFYNIAYKNGRFLQKIALTVWGHIVRLYDIMRAPSYDIVYVHLWVTPFGLPIYEWLISRVNRNIIFDIDDLIFLNPASQANSWVSKLKKSRKCFYLMRVAKQVIVCTPYLEQIAKLYNNEVTDISSTVDTEKYRITNEYENTGIIKLGWSGSSSTGKYLRLLEPVFAELVKITRVQLVVIGDANFRSDFIEVIHVPWAAESEVADLGKIDIGLYPLPDEEWVMGKSGLKAIQYMAMGIPTVATDIGANARVIEHEKSGFLVQSKEEWIEKILLLCSRPDIRKSIGLEARKRVEKLFSIHTNKDKYLKVLRSFPATSQL